MDSSRRTLLTAEPDGTPDGFRGDVDGNLWCGKLIGRIDLPERCANLCFGGLRRKRLFMAASTSVYSVYVNTQGAPGG